MSKPKGVKDIEIPVEVLKELLTESELKMLKNRFQIINLLAKGLSIRATAQRAGVGTDTVMRVSKMIDKDKLNKLVPPNLPQKETSTYIFGKSRV